MELFAHPATAGVPFVLETPGSREPGNDDIPLLQEAARAGPRVSTDRRTTLLATAALLGMTAAGAARST